MDNTLRVTDPVVSAHLAEVHTQIEELFSRYPEDRRKGQSKKPERCRELILLRSSYKFEEEGYDGQSDIEFALHQDPMLGQMLDQNDWRRCSEPYVLLELTRTSITVNGPARSVKTYRIMISWTVAWAHLENRNLTLKILRETTTKTGGLPPETVRRYKWSESKISDSIVKATLDELTEATGEIISILSDHTPS